MLKLGAVIAGFTGLLIVCLASDSNIIGVDEDSNLDQQTSIITKLRNRRSEISTVKRSPIVKREAGCSPECSKYGECEGKGIIGM